MSMQVAWPLSCHWCHRLPLHSPSPHEPWLTLLQSRDAIEVHYTYTASAPHSLSIPIVYKGDLLSEVNLGASWSAVPIFWQWHGSSLKATGLLAHLGSVSKHTWAIVASHFAGLAGPPVMPHAGSARAVGSKHPEGSWSGWCCTSEWEKSLGGVIPWAKTLMSGHYVVPLWGLWRTSATLTGRVLEASSLVKGDSALSKTEKLNFIFPVVSRWAKISVRVNRREWQLVISGPPSWCGSYQMGMYWRAPVLRIEGNNEREPSRSRLLIFWLLSTWVSTHFYRFKHGP